MKVFFYAILSLLAVLESATSVFAQSEMDVADDLPFFQRMIALLKHDFRCDYDLSKAQKTFLHIENTGKASEEVEVEIYAQEDGKRILVERKSLIISHEEGKNNVALDISGIVGRDKAVGDVVVKGSVFLNVYWVVGDVSPDGEVTKKRLECIKGEEVINEGKEPEANNGECQCVVADGRTVRRFVEKKALLEKTVIVSDGCKGNKGDGPMCNARSCHYKVVLVDEQSGMEIETIEENKEFACSSKE